ncbi:MAG: hypothetical protein ACE5JZ_02955 [Kiloniellales bacterium]
MLGFVDLRFEVDPRQQKILETVRGVGYVLNARAKHAGAEE